MNYKLLLGIELEKTKDLEEKLIKRDIEISNLIDDIKRLKSTIETQEHHIAVLNDREPEVVYISRDSTYG